MQINWEISVGNLITIAIIAIGGLRMLFTIQNKIDLIGAEVKRLTRRADIVETGLEAVERALVTVAVQTERMNNQDNRMNRFAEELRDLKHGDGFVLPLPTGRSP